MPLKFEDDPDAMARVLTILRRLRDPSMRRGLSQALSEAALREVREGFVRGITPDDISWPASIRVQEFGGTTLTDTGKLKGSWSAVVTADGFTLATRRGTGAAKSIRFAYVHQFGATIRAKRPWFGHPPRPMLLFRPAGRRGTTWALKPSVVIPKRPMVPEGRTLPERWARAFLDAAIRYMATQAR